VVKKSAIAASFGLIGSCTSPHPLGHPASAIVPIHDQKDANSLFHVLGPIGVATLSGCLKSLLPAIFGDPPQGQQSTGS
jgi:hypothetical protein